MCFGSDGGRGGIRTPDGLAPMPVFKTGAFNHSATRPQKLETIQKVNGARHMTDSICVQAFL